MRPRYTHISHPLGQKVQRSQHGRWDAKTQQEAPTLAQHIIERSDASFNVHILLLHATVSCQCLSALSFPSRPSGWINRNIRSPFSRTIASMVP
jgi:hypothetical protein